MSSFHLLEKLQDFIDLREKFASCNGDYTLFLNAIQFALSAPEHPTKMYIYRVGDPEDPYYVAVHLPRIIIGSPLSGQQHEPTLKTLFSELFFSILPEIVPDKTEFIIDSDDRDVVEVQQSLFRGTLQFGAFRRGVTTFARQFHMTEDQAAAIRQAALVVPKNCWLSEVDVDKECADIHKAWHAHLHLGILDEEYTRGQLLHAPSSCVRSEGKLAAWAASENFMQMYIPFPSSERTAQQKELDLIAELKLAKDYLEMGYHPCTGMQAEFLDVPLNRNELAAVRNSGHWTEGKLHAWSRFSRANEHEQDYVEWCAIMQRNGQ